MWDHFVLHQYLCGTTLCCTVYLISTYVGPLCIASVPMWDHFVLHCLPHQYLCGTICIVSVHMWDHFVLHCLLHQYLFGPLCIATVGICLISRPTYMWDHFECLPHQYLCVTTLYCISTYVGPLCIARLTSSVPMWDHFALHQYLCGTTLYCTVYLISTYVGPLCIAKVGIYLISRPTCMCDHFVLHCDCLPHQYLCGTTLYCISTYVGPLCVVLFTSSVPMWDHFALHQYLCGTTLYCTVYLTSTYVGP